MTTAVPSSPTPISGPDRLVDSIDALLPQTQCQRCGYPACRPYAEAVARGEADINQCPPGGEAGIQRLAALLGREAKPLSPQHGTEKPLQVALIDENLCIGCLLCIKACPVDAIVGANKRMHTVIAAQCTGCELCIAPCPVDCIEMVAPPIPLARGDATVMSAAEQAMADASRQRYEFRQFRLQRDEQERSTRLAAMSPAAEQVDTKSRIAAALLQARSKASSA